MQKKVLLSGLILVVVSSILRRRLEGSERRAIYEEKDGSQSEGYSYPVLVTRVVTLGVSNTESKE